MAGGEGGRSKKQGEEGKREEKAKYGKGKGIIGRKSENGRGKGKRKKGKGKWMQVKVRIGREEG